MSETNTESNAAASGDESPISDAEFVRRERLMRSPSVLGYADVRSVRAGDQISFFVSSACDHAFDAKIVRIKSPDIGPIARSTRAIDTPASA